MNIELYQDPESEFAACHVRCEECALISACPTWQRGKLSDLRGMKEKAGSCGHWRPMGCMLDAPDGACATCLHNQDGRCDVLANLAAEAGWARTFCVNALSRACCHYAPDDATVESAVVAHADEGSAVTNVQTSAHLQSLTTEINVMSAQMVQNALLIGQRLQQVKQLLPHGEFAPYVEAHCGFKPRLAQQFMRIASEYTMESLPAGVSVSKLYELLALPSADRQAFVETHDVESATVRELREEIRQARAAAADAQSDNEALQIQLEAARANLDYAGVQLDEARQELLRVGGSEAQLQGRLDALQRVNAGLEAQLGQAEQALAERPTKTVGVEVERVVPPADYEDIRHQNAQLRNRLRELERPAVELESLVRDTFERWRLLCERFENMTDESDSVLRRNLAPAKTDAARCAWLNGLVQIWESYATEMHAHLTRFMAEAGEDG